MDEITDDVIQRVKGERENQGRELHLLKNQFAQVIVRVPNGGEYQRFVDEMGNPELKGTALRTLVFSCVAHPAAAEFRALYEQRPALVQTIGNELVELAGLKAVTDRKKL